MDKVFIRNLQVYGILGIHAHEQLAPREIRVSVMATTDIRAAALADDIEHTVNYSKLANHITQFIQAKPWLTIEALIEALAGDILADERISTVWLRVEKPGAVPQADSVGVEITRPRAS
jgi:dihydroneopterin aldolase